MAFDPKFPSAFYLPESIVTNSFRFILAEDGVGCNAEETSSLMKLLQVRDESYDKLNLVSRDVPMSSRDARALSQRYRQILIECYTLWMERCAAQKSNQMETSNDSTDKDAQNKEEISLSLLQRTLGIMHLSEIFLLTPTFEGITDSNTAGIVTADTVRYLRSVHMLDPVDSIRHVLPSSMTVDDLLAQPQPEYFVRMGDMDSVMPPFWILLRTFVLRGQLEDAWTLLTKHSAYRRCHQAYHGKNATYAIHPTIAEEWEAFHIIRSILLTAPLPGGRNSLNDSGIALLGDEDASSSSSSSSSSSPSQKDDEHHFQSISSFAYKLWDMDLDQHNHASNRWSGTRNLPSHPIPAHFNIHGAYNMYKSWKSSVSTLLKTNVPLKNLLTRIPLLKPCLWDIILVTKDFTFEPTDSWSEVLAHELIYIQPYMKKEDVHVRFSAAISSRFGPSSGDPAFQTFLDISKLIMKENAAVVLESLHAYGGKSGAALPATQTALLCDLLVRTDQLIPSISGYDFHTELFLNASTSIISSFASQHHCDVGIRLATKLLLPYAGPDNIPINARLAELLSYHYPQSDYEADSLISLCRPLTNRGSRRILDACESLTMCRAQLYERKGQLAASVTWLLKGTEIHRETMKAHTEANSNPSVVASSNFSKLLCMFLRLSMGLLNSCLSQDPDIGKLVKQAGEVVQVIPTDDSNDTVASEPAFLLLRGTVSLVENVMNKNYTESAKALVYCLDDRLDPSGAVITLAHPTTFGLYLAISYAIIKSEESTGSGFSKMVSSFDVHGVQILMMRFAQWQSLDSYGYKLDDRSRTIVPKDMQHALAKSLMRAFLSENAQLRKKPSSVPIAHFSGAVTPEEINQMLEPSLFM